MLNNFYFVRHQSNKKNDCISFVIKFLKVRWKFLGKFYGVYKKALFFIFGIYNNSYWSVIYERNFHISTKNTSFNWLC